MAKIEPGRIAPDFALTDQHGRTHARKDYAGRALVLCFYPKDLTTACTDEVCSFGAAAATLLDAGAAVLGVSILGVDSKAAFAAATGITYPLLADDAVDKAGAPAPVVSRKYGVWVEKQMYGRTYMGIERTTYLIDGRGRVVRRWDKVKVKGHVEEVVEAVGGL